MHNRIKLIAKELKIKQSDLIKLWEVKQPTISSKINGATAISAKEAQLFAEHFDINLQWLMTGEGVARKGMEIKDEEVIYEPAPSDTAGIYTRKAIAARFNEQLSWYEENYKIMKGELALKMDVAHAHLASIRVGRKDVSLKVLIAMQKLGMDSNYTLGGHGTLMRSTRPVTVGIQSQLDEIKHKLEEMTAAREHAAG